MTKRSEKRLKQKKRLFARQKADTPHIIESKPTESKQIKNPFIRYYDKNYKKLLIIPVVLFILAIIQISFQMATHEGDFINKDISLSGGITVSIPRDAPVDTVEMVLYLSEKGYSTSVRNLESGGRTLAVLVESDLDINDKETIDNLIVALKEKISFDDDSYSLEGISSSIGDSFFKQTMIAMIFSFILMGIIVSINFKSFVPSIAVIAAALSDIIITMAIVNIMGIRVSTAGIAAFLMLIGYSVDTDILLTTRLLKRKEGSTMDRIISAMKTGMLMNFTTIVVMIIGLLVSSSEVIRQIMIILFIGLLVDQINTWIQNVGILRLYIEKKEKQISENEL